MKTILFSITLTGLALFSCNTRKSDKVVDDIQKLKAAAVKDSTTVAVIDSIYNFGTITEGEKVEYSFRFTNTGSKPLVILSTTASCGCTIPQKPEKPIMPGEMGFIKVVFDSKGKVGHNTKTIVVASNAMPPFKDLLLEGEVVQKQ